jgi:hypothetical protein
MNGKLNGSLFSTVRFKSAGTLTCPDSAGAADATGTKSQ